MKLPIQNTPVQRSGNTVAVDFGSRVTPSLDLKQLCAAGCKVLPAPMQAACMEVCSRL
ncbi:hypothetical protein LQG66_01435 [Bradyrhizobium ontarionense]|uniref:Uncharacterized protein n=1 Tax=Bradyrhizobium ontarionense TaxID=2898149 RepID=A0ABY3RDH8_9BRAD|nr:hypothetical protein [Bradyrhizobium sp. A19]UFZ05010.1 hypothetical protein LQG66_01435 [Bradyrhizobium sp. A19]